jgi:hypothetical protein
MLGDPVILSANYINIGARSERSKFGKNIRRLHILKAEKLSNFCTGPLYSRILTSLNTFFGKFGSVTPNFFGVNPSNARSCVNMRKSEF